MDAETLAAHLKYLDIVKDIVLSHVNRQKYVVFLFGSRVGQNYRHDSDVDIGVWGHEPLGRAYYQIMNDLEESMVPYHVDLVDFSKVEERFRAAALQEIEIWNEPENWPESGKQN